jgi:phosphatidylserine decarboxylase
MMLTFQIVAAVLVLYGIWRLYFLRNPQRITPLGNVVVAPADGYVVYVKRVERGEVPFAVKNHRSIRLSEVHDVKELEQASGLLIGIFMTPFSVHRNRAPVRGEVVLKKYFKNRLNLSMIWPFVEIFFRFKRFTDSEFYLTNERLTTGLRTARGMVFMTQIADEWINRIVSWVEPGDTLECGQQYGMIRFGSQCDTFIPDSFGLDVTVKIGQRVYAGETVLGTYNDDAPAPQP